ncbi:unnamed protein product [Knipowitschia caucasica]|uniref:Uncharacterized protein n=1 Tax=Knipowitschia caucasica TaxID=637954 RepID=A0AAV2JY52_KNICA
MKTVVVLASSVLLLPLLLADFSPQDSTCKAIWLFNLPCARPNRALVRQVMNWSSNKCADEEEKCMYKVVRSTSYFLEVMHTSPDSSQTTVMYFDFYPPQHSNFCKIWAYAVTSPFNATNAREFCLFHNLFQASGLTTVPGFREITDVRMCPSVSTATCL